MRGYIRETNGTLSFVDIDFDGCFICRGCRINVTEEIINLDSWFDSPVRVAYSLGGREVLLPVELDELIVFDTQYKVSPYDVTVPYDPDFGY